MTQQVARRAPITGYLWRAYRSEPGWHGARYQITRQPEPPALIDGIHATKDLVYDWSLYGDWSLIGEIVHPIVDYTECDWRAIGVEIDGRVQDAEELSESHRYRHIAGAV